MGGPGPAFGPWGMGGPRQQYLYPPAQGVTWGSINISQLPPRAQYLALRNAADGKKAYCAYCGGRATWDDGKNCPKCGATETEMK